MTHALFHTPSTPRRIRARRTSALFADLEVLERRTLLTVTISTNARIATFKDVSGNLVTITFSKGTLTPGIFTTVASGQGEQLETIDLSGGGFDGTNITMKVKTPPGQSGIGDVGYINSTGHDLGVVSLPGDLGRIDAGDADLSTPAIKFLSVTSIGAKGTATQDVGGTLVSNINGPMGPLTLQGNFVNATFNVTGAPTASMGPIKILGGLTGGGSDGSGAISVAGNIASVNIFGSLQGGSGQNSGSITSVNGTIGNVTVQGNLKGGTGEGSGAVSAHGNIGAVKVFGGLLGSSGDQSGQVISTAGSVAGLTVLGSMTGGAGESSGSVFGFLNVGAVKISGSLSGGGGEFSGSAQAQTGNVSSFSVSGSMNGGNGQQSGFLFSNLSPGAIKISGSLNGSAGEQSGSIASNATLPSVTISGGVGGGTGDNSGQIFAQGAISNVTINGSLNGNTGDQSGTVESATGALGTLTIKGFLSGTNSGGGVSAASIGKVSIGGGVSSAFLIANTGAIGSVSCLGSIGAAPGFTTAISAATTIGSITIKQGVTGSADGLVVISAGGLLNGNTDVAIKSINITGDVSFTNIFAGYTTNLIPSDRHASIGAVKISGNLTASNMVAGAQNANSSNTNFGDANDTRIPANSSSDSETPLSSIASITIGGTVDGTGANSNDHFGFVAQSIGAVSIHKSKLTLNPAPDTDFVAIGTAGDFNVREV